jgi:predicted amidohydrolase
VENRVYVVHANAAAPQASGKDADGAGSHGSSRIVGPTGIVLVEAQVQGAAQLLRSLDLRLAQKGDAEPPVREHAHASYARECLREGTWTDLRSFWAEGVEDLVTVVERGP